MNSFQWYASYCSLANLAADSRWLTERMQGPLENSQADTLDQEADEEVAGALDWTLPSDTVAATHLLKAQFPKAAQVG